MEKSKSERNFISSKTSTITTGGLIGFLFLSGFTALMHGQFTSKPNYDQPHEYIRTETFGINGESTAHNDNWYSLKPLKKYNYFEIGLDRCTSFLENLKEQDVDNSLRAFNHFLDLQEDYNDIRIFRLTMQCVEFTGNDQECLKRAESKKDSAIKDGKSTALLAYFDHLETCRIETPIGSPRNFTLTPLR